jgi:hypothetical protein
LSSNLERIVSGEHLTTNIFLAAQFILDFFMRGHGFGRIQGLILAWVFSLLSPSPQGNHSWMLP